MADQAERSNSKDSGLTQRDFGRGDQCDFTEKELAITDAFWDAMGRAEKAAQSGRTSPPRNFSEEDIAIVDHLDRERIEADERKPPAAR
jgi:hypothetical protein